MAVSRLKRWSVIWFSSLRVWVVAEHRQRRSLREEASCASRTGSSCAYKFYLKICNLLIQCLCSLANDRLIAKALLIRPPKPSKFNRLPEQPFQEAATKYCIQVLWSLESSDCLTPEVLVLEVFSPSNSRSSSLERTTYGCSTAAVLFWASGTGQVHCVKSFNF